jgi:hypothetical protein
VDRDLIAERLGHGDYDGPGRATVILTDGAAPIRRSNVSPWVFDTHDVERLDGTTTEVRDLHRGPTATTGSPCAASIGRDILPARSPSLLAGLEVVSADVGAMAEFGRKRVGSTPVTATWS